VTSLALNDPGSLAASGGSDGVVRVWDTRAGERIPFVLRHPAGPISALAFSHDDRWLVSAGPSSVRVFALADGALVNEIHVDGRPLTVTIDPGNRLMAVGDSSGNIFLAAPDGSAGQFTFRGGSPITALRFAHEPGLLASGSAAGDLVFWDTLTVAASSASRHFAGPIRWIAFAPDSSGLHLQSGSWLHSLDRTDDSTRVVASVLLPERLRVAPALVLSRDGVSVSALARAGGRSLAFGIVPLGAAAQVLDITSDPTAGAVLPQRDWRGVLGIELDTASGEIRRIAP
jgi:WD40 repeat protein